MTKPKAKTSNPGPVRFDWVSAVALPNDQTPVLYALDQEGQVWVHHQAWTKLPMPEEGAA